jgi:hypothetical protein
MTALFVGHTAANAVLGLSPWIIPVIAVAAKRTYDRGRDTLRGGHSADRAANAPGATPGRRATPPIVMDERLRARVAAMIWPD